MTKASHCDGVAREEILGYVHRSCTHGKQPTINSQCMNILSGETAEDQGLPFAGFWSLSLEQETDVFAVLTTD